MNLAEKKVNEATDATAYKHMLKSLGDYSTKNAFTGVDGLFKTACDKGKKIMPKDKNALSILQYVIMQPTSSSSVQRLLNTRFSSLPIELRPMAKDDEKKEVAMWMIGDRISDKVVDLIDFTGEGKGYWCNVQGEKVSLVDFDEEIYVPPMEPM